MEYTCLFMYMNLDLLRSGVVITTTFLYGENLNRLSCIHLCLPSN